MTHKTQTRWIIQRLRHIFPFVLIIVVMLVIAGNSTKVFQQFGTPSSPTPTPTPAPSKTFTSDKLGISFSYLTVISGRQNFFTKEIGDTVYLYYNLSTNQPFVGSDAEFLKTIPGHGYSVEVFTKDPQQALQDAIKQQFLTGHSENDCFVRTTRNGHPREDESFQTAIIDFPHHSNQTHAQLEASVAKCPYVKSFDDASYFMMDPKHSNKLLYVKLGQDNIPSGVNGSMWDATIKVF